jgi:hypothetical protein
MLQEARNYHSVVYRKYYDEIFVIQKNDLRVCSQKMYEKSIIDVIKQYQIIIQIPKCDFICLDFVMLMVPVSFF